MSDVCDCTPGSESDGWQEHRCDACVEAEMRAWGHVIAWARNGDVVKRIAMRADQ